MTKKDSQTALFERSFFHFAEEYPTNLVYTNYLPYQHNDYLELLTRLQPKLFCEPTRTNVEFVDLPDDASCKMEMVAVM